MSLSKRVIKFAHSSYQKIRDVTPTLSNAIADLSIVADEILPAKYKNRLDEFKQVLTDIKAKSIDLITPEQKQLFDNIITSIMDSDIVKSLSDEDIIPGTTVTKDELLEIEKAEHTGAGEFSWDILRETLIPLSSVNIYGYKVPLFAVQIALFIVVFLILSWFDFSQKSSAFYSASITFVITLVSLYYRKELNL